MGPEVIKELSGEHSTVLEILERIQDNYGCISGKAMQELSELMNITVSDIYGIATFYSFLYVEPQGAYIIRVCKSLPCYLKNYELIVGTIKKEIGIGPGETTGDGKFSLHLTNCIGACDQAPAMMVNDDLHVNLTPDKIAGILKGYQ
jgi:NADH:ubiquinone oxidoreductase subunit E